jgi:REP element-mobilizing transposase RayT
MPDPLGYLITWATYGSWLPGDERGWTKWHGGPQSPNLRRELEAAAQMNEAAVLLDAEQRRVVERTIAEHCDLRGWKLHVANCRSNHVHVVLTANLHPDQLRSQLKGWSARRLNEHARARGNLAHGGRRSWWGERGSRRFLNDETALEGAIVYVRDAQDWPCG